MDELADEYATGKSSSDVFKNAHQKDFTKGFQKALSILGDKKFSEEDVKRAMDVTLNYETKRDAESYQEKIDFLKSLQQTEFDVEVIMEYKQQLANGYKNQYENVVVPKLDADGCLIIKRIDYGRI